MMALSLSSELTMTRADNDHYFFDFDLVLEGIDLENLVNTAEKHHVILGRLVFEGPGGGNPNVFASCQSKYDARKFLYEVYGCKTLEDAETFVFPITDQL
jgi:hypothetical protein